MNKICFSVALVIASLSAIAEQRSISEIMKTPVAQLTPEERQIRSAHMKEVRQRVFGDDIVKPGSLKGCITILDMQDKLPSKEIDAAISMLSNATKLKFEVVKPDDVSGCAIESANKASAGKSDGVFVLVVADEKTPAMLVAPENRWAIVNVAKLDEGIPAGALYSNMFAGRCRKEIVRAFSLLCGGGSSQFANNLTDAATIEELDTVKEFLPIDMEKRYTTYLGKIGVRPAYVRNYKQACVEGWAPAPTNENQKAIWNKVHEVPSNPMKIEFDPKKGR